MRRKEFEIGPGAGIDLQSDSGLPEDVRRALPAEKRTLPRQAGLTEDDLKKQRLRTLETIEQLDKEEVIPDLADALEDPSLEEETATKTVQLEEKLDTIRAKLQPAGIEGVYAVGGRGEDNSETQYVRQQFLAINELLPLPGAKHTARGEATIEQLHQAEGIMDKLNTYLDDIIAAREQIERIERSPSAG